MLALAGTRRFLPHLEASLGIDKSRIEGYISVICKDDESVAQRPGSRDGILHAKADLGHALMTRRV